jgi:endo-1,4-beta-D-glucanase Y
MKFPPFLRLVALLAVLTVSLFPEMRISAAESSEECAEPFPQARAEGRGILRPSWQSQEEMNEAVKRYYFFWKGKYLKPSVKVPGDFKVAFDRSGTTVSEAMGYGMLITVTMAGADPEAKAVFDGLNRFRKRYPSSINPVFMSWKIPPSEKVVRNDSATDGDLDMALALLMAHKQWGDEVYLLEARGLIHALAHALVRPDYSLRLGDWDTEPTSPTLTRPSDFMPTHFCAFQKETGDAVWEKVTSRCYDILEELQTKSAPSTGLVPDFAEAKNGVWKQAKPGALEGNHDGDYSYNARRVPWRIGWAASALGDRRACQILKRLMRWAVQHVGKPEDFKAGYHLDGRALRGADFDSACFIAPTGVAAGRGKEEVKMKLQRMQRNGQASNEEGLREGEILVLARTLKRKAEGC